MVTVIEVPAVLVTVKVTWYLVALAMVAAFVRATVLPVVWVQVPETQFQLVPEKLLVSAVPYVGRSVAVVPTTSNRLAGVVVVPIVTPPLLKTFRAWRLPVEPRLSGSELVALRYEEVTAEPLAM